MFVLGRVLHWGAKIKILDIHANGFGVIGEYDVIYEKFGGCNIGSAGAFFTRIINKVETNS